MKCNTHNEFPRFYWMYLKVLVGPLRDCKTSKNIREPWFEALAGAVSRPREAGQRSISCVNTIDL